MARPKNTDGEKRTVRIAFMVSESEDQELRALAKAHGFDQYSMFVRSASLGKIVVDRSRIATSHAVPSESKPLAMDNTPVRDHDWVQTATAEQLREALKEWKKNPNAVPVILESTVQHDSFYDVRVDQWLRTSDGKPKFGQEKPGRAYHKPIIIQSDVGILEEADDKSETKPPHKTAEERDKAAEKEKARLKAEELKRTLPTLTADNFYTVTKPLEGWERWIARFDVMSAEERAKLEDKDWEKTQAREARQAAEWEAEQEAKRQAELGDADEEYEEDDESEEAS